MCGTGNDDFLFRRFQFRIGCIGEIFGMSLFPGNNQDRTRADFIEVFHEGEVKESIGRRRIPGQFVGIDGTGMEGAAYIVVIKALGYFVGIIWQLLREQGILEMTFPLSSTGNS